MTSLSEYWIGLTIRYVPKEDRIRMTSSVGDGDTVDFWFTRRILKNLISGLTNWLEAREPATVPIPSRDLPKAVHHQLAQEQATAQMGMRQAKPVSQSATTRESLVTRLSVRTRAETLILDLPLDQSEKGCASFSRTTLNQWLGILLSSIPGGRMAT